MFLKDLGVFSEVGALDSRGPSQGPSYLTFSGGHSPGRPQVALQDHSPEPCSAQGSPKSPSLGRRNQQAEAEIQGLALPVAPIPSGIFQVNGLKGI